MVLSNPHHDLSDFYWGSLADDVLSSADFSLHAALCDLRDQGNHMMILAECLMK